VLDIGLDVRISGAIRLGGGAGRHRFRVKQAPRGVLRTLQAAAAEIGEDVRAEPPPYENESLRLLPYRGGRGARHDVQHLDPDRLADHEVRGLSDSNGQQEAAEPRFRKEVAEAERLLKSLASALALRLLSRAATETRRAIADAKRSIRSKDPDRVRQASERLREGAIRLAEAMRRVSAAAAGDEERSLDHSEVVDGTSSRRRRGRLRKE
jgi:hypothetical protein